MYCSKCGTEVGEDARYCPNCGAEIKVQNECLQGIVNIENNKKEQDKKQSAKDILVLIVTLLGMVVITMLLSMLLSWLFNNDVVIEKMGNIEKSAGDWLNKPDKPWNNSWQKSIDTYKPGDYFDEQHDLVYNYYDDKDGLQDLQDNIVIPCEYDNIWFESELSLIMAEKEGGRATDIYSRDGEKVLSVDGTVRPDFCTKCLVGYIENIPTMSDEEWDEEVNYEYAYDVKLVNLQGELIEQKIDDFEQCGNVYKIETSRVSFDNLEWYDYSCGGNYIMNEKGERISDIFPVMDHYDEINHIFQVKTEEGYLYYIDEKGNEIAEAQSQWDYYLGFVNGKFKVSVVENDNEYVGIAETMDSNANMVLEAEYETIEGENGVYWASKDLEDGRRRYALFDGSGEQITDFIYDEISLIYDENGEFVDHIEARKESGVSDIYYLKSGIAYHICKLQEEKYIDIWKIKDQYYYIVQENTGYGLVEIFDKSGNILLNQQAQDLYSDDRNEDNGLLALRYEEDYKDNKENIHIFDVVSGKEIRVLKDVAYFKMVKNGVCYYDGNTKEYIVEEILKNDKTQSVTWKKMLKTKKPVTVEDDVYSIKIQEQRAHYVGN